MGVVTKEQLAGMSYEDFIQIFGNVIEHCAICSAAVWAKRPFYNLKELHSAICTFVDELPKIGREGILRLHPDLAGRIAELGRLTSESSKEQLSAGLNDITVEEKSVLQALNDRYKSKFGFPFVICARENKKQAILSGIAARVENDKDVELATGIAEVKKIAFYRLLDIVEHSDEEAKL
ncbi:2-oxo-4-hydroxy-4-carboxy-5-ureidoimidazoline decarboxylase [Orchesella cincta]|uniref:2-oxo-4-hydroxy-4-carboxy-5-ureidoimidazoline decarboxylase n=1 Tax=Orchesella cincta TaxID=48709 RepID=A0A1D2MZ07_ORCCI|nr:2-oxo-4-hydroxy-4-carboxy-5-ureidoimidazoline decarboxylase [Orchesella cincta]